ncbi:MAG: AAA family ATPase [Actinobacteria bacterium]|nr:AAA family ATPase [Actinomycetota bacterium]
MEIVGREDEVAALHAFFDRAGQGDGAAPAAVVLEGDAGIGKSTLWLAGVEVAREQGVASVDGAACGGRAQAGVRCAR